MLIKVALLYWMNDSGARRIRLFILNTKLKYLDGVSILKITKHPNPNKLNVRVIQFNFLQ